MTERLSLTARVAALEELVIALLHIRELEQSKIDLLVTKASENLKNRPDLREISKGNAVKYLDNVWSNLSDRPDGE